MRTLALATRSVVLVVAVGCEPREQSPGATTTTAATPVSNDTAVMRLTSARCERELACNNIGAGRKFADRDACTREVGHNAQAVLREEACPRGVDDRRLSTCLGDVRGQRCGNPLDAIDRLLSCRRAELCR